MRALVLYAVALAGLEITHVAQNQKMNELEDAALDEKEGWPCRKVGTGPRSPDLARVARVSSNRRQGIFATVQVLAN